jgi:hypothetical protein
LPNFPSQFITEIKKVHKKFTFIPPSSRDPRCRTTVFINGSASTASRKGLLASAIGGEYQTGNPRGVASQLG